MGRGGPGGGGGKLKGTFRHLHLRTKVTPGRCYMVYDLGSSGCLIRCRIT